MLLKKTEFILKSISYISTYLGFGKNMACRLVSNNVMERILLDKNSVIEIQQILRKRMVDGIEIYYD